MKFFPQHVDSAFQDGSEGDQPDQHGDRDGHECRFKFKVAAETFFRSTYRYGIRYEYTFPWRGFEGKLHGP